MQASNIILNSRDNKYLGNFRKKEWTKSMMMWTGVVSASGGIAYIGHYLSA